MREVTISLPQYREFWTRLRHNLASPDTQLMAVVKANAYGLGAIPLSTFLQTEGLVNYLGVATVPEAIALRNAHIALPILVLSHPEPETLSSLLSYNLEQVVYTANAILELQALAESHHAQIQVHLKIDTGMGRAGCLPAQAATLVDLIQTSPNLHLKGVCTHFACADEPESEFTQTQLQTFLDTLAPLHLSPQIIRHAANSAATQYFPDTHLDMIRIGMDSYLTIATLKTQVQSVKTVGANTPISYGSTYHTPAATQIAVLDIGYADGIPRSFMGEVLIHEKRYPVVGRVCMDMMMVNVGQDPIQTGDEAVLFGHQGQAHISLEEFSAHAHRIPYESLCTLGDRVTRHYQV